MPRPDEEDLTDEEMEAFSSLGVRDPFDFGREVDIDEEEEVKEVDEDED